MEFLSSLDFAAIFTAGGMAMLAQIIVADLTMAGDNVLIMGTIASGLPAKERQKVILLGVGIALVFLIGFALVAKTEKAERQCCADSSRRSSICCCSGRARR